MAAVEKYNAEHWQDTIGRAYARGILITLGVDVPFTSLCPCSKAISRYGAHNQRSVCKVKVRFAVGHECIFIEDLVTLLERQGSSPIYPLLKREDEKYVTEAAYEHPKFVEDILRDCVLALRQLPGLAWFSLNFVNNFIFIFPCLCCRLLSCLLTHFMNINSILYRCFRAI